MDSGGTRDSMAAKKKATRKQTANPTPVVGEAAGDASAAPAPAAAKRAAKPRGAVKRPSAAKAGSAARSKSAAGSESAPQTAPKRGTRRSAAVEASAPAGKAVKTTTGKSLVIVESPTK